MSTLLLILLSFTFLSLSVLHFFWAFGGTWGLDATLPTSVDGTRLLNPKPRDSAIVGFGLLAFGSFYALLLSFIPDLLPAWMITYLLWITPSIFLLRAIGDFRYVGFFKRVRTTKFGEWDSKLFSPFCLALAGLGFGVALLI